MPLLRFYLNLSKVCDGLGPSLFGHNSSHMSGWLRAVEGIGGPCALSPHKSLPTSPPLLALNGRISVPYRNAFVESERLVGCDAPYSDILLFPGDLFYHILDALNLPGSGPASNRDLS